MSREGRIGYSLPELDVPETELESLLERIKAWINSVVSPRKSGIMPHNIELWYFRQLCVGSCTMKYNPKLNEKIARFAGFSAIHPLQDEDTDRAIFSFNFGLYFIVQEPSG
jgi:glycine dehydrogenase subunit 2